jgi:hypothetical protein
MSIPARLLPLLVGTLFVTAAGLLGPASAVANETGCTPLNVMVFESRVHVKCVETVGNIAYFAASTEDSGNASRVLNVLSTALAAGRTLSIIYDPADTSGAAIGCQINDCRLIQGVALWQ